MGTRNVTIVKMNGETKIAQYCQWDGYPTGQGADIAEFIQKRLTTPEGLAQFRERVAAVSWITPERHKALWVECGASPDNDWVTMDVSSKFAARYPELHRDTGARILGLVYDGKAKELQNSEDFAIESSGGFGCEYVYVLDLDTQQVNVYGGTVRPDNLMKTYSFDKFTAKAMKDLEASEREE